MYHNGFRSVYKLNAHVVLVVKYRIPAISAEILARLEQILKQTLNKWESELLEFNGESEHVHLLIDYKPDIPLSTLIGNLKTVSSRLIRTRISLVSTKIFLQQTLFHRRVLTLLLVAVVLRLNN